MSYSHIVAFDVLDRITRQIQKHIDLTGEGDVVGINADHIVIWSAPFSPDGGTTHQVHNTPGVIVSPGRFTKVPPEGGSNREEDVYYFISIQIVDKCYSRLDRDRLASWLKWQQHIRAFFSSNNMRNEIESEHGNILIVSSPEINPLDDKLFYVANDCIGAIGLEVKVREPRNTEGFR